LPEPRKPVRMVAGMRAMTGTSRGKGEGSLAGA
jgi:hypothetical protein